MLRQIDYMETLLIAMITLLCGVAIAQIVILLKMVL